MAYASVNLYSCFRCSRSRLARVRTSEVWASDSKVTFSIAVSSYEAADERCSSSLTVGLNSTASWRLRCRLLTLASFAHQLDDLHTAARQRRIEDIERDE